LAHLKVLRQKDCASVATADAIPLVFQARAIGAKAMVWLVHSTPTQNFLVDIVLSGADTFSGVVKFPEGLLASGEEEIQVLLRASSFSNPAIFSQVITPDPGQSEWPFFITAPQLVGVGGWSLELSCRTCNERIVTSLHYPTQRSGDPMTLESNRGFFFVKFVSSTNMLMTFIEIPEQPTTTNVPAAIPLLLLGD